MIPLLPLALLSQTELEGFIPRDTVGVGAYRVIIHEPEAPEESQLRLAIIDSSDSLLFVVGDSSWPLSILDGSTGQDIDGDGSPDLVVTRLSGGECVECVKLSVWSMGTDSVMPVRFGLADWAWPQYLEDMEGDGQLEIVAVDLRWLNFTEGCEMCGPPVLTIWRRSDDGWHEKSSLYRDFYGRRLTGALGVIRELQEGPQLKAAVVSYVVTTLYSGNPEGAWESLADLYPDGDAVAGVGTRIKELLLPEE